MRLYRHERQTLIPEAFITQLLDRVDLVELIQRHVRLKKTGTDWSGLCPFHGEKTPSFTVSPTKQFYHCFGCGAHGTAITFLMKHLGHDFREAVNALAVPLGLTVPNERVVPPEVTENKTQLSNLMTEAVKFYKSALKDSPSAIDYLKNRGIAGRTAARFGLGYAPNDFHALKQHLPATVTNEQLIQAGLLVNNERGKTYDRFRHRIMFPISNTNGQFIGFGARSLDGTEPKYLNSPETPLFSKGRELYGLYQAKASITKAGYCWVTEGYFDVLMLSQAGIEHVVASLGTAVTTDQLRKLLRYTDKLIFCFDGDAAGRKAAIRVMSAAAELATDQRSFFFLFLPSGEDPDSFVRKHGRERFEQLQSSAMPLSRLLLQQWATGHDLTILEDRAAMLSEAKTILGKMTNAPALRSAIIAELAEQTGLMTTQIDQLAHTTTPESSEKVKSMTPMSLADRLLSVLLTKPQWRLEIDPDQAWLTLPGLDCELLAAAITLSRAEAESVSEQEDKGLVALLMAHFPEQEYRDHLSKVQAFRHGCQLSEEELRAEWHDGVGQLKHNWRQFELNRLKRLAMERPLNDDEHQRMYELMSSFKPRQQP